MNYAIYRPTAYASLLLCFFSLILTGCASISLNISNDEFMNEHQKTVEFNPSSVQADFLGKVDNKYMFEIVDSKNRKVLFSLPAKQNDTAEIELDNSDNITTTGKSSIFLLKTEFLSDTKGAEWERYFHDYELTPTSNADFPQHVYVVMGKEKTRFYYACKDGKFHSEIDKSIKAGVECYRDHNEHNCHGLSFSDSFTLGLRNTGYLVTVPLDCASLPVVLPFAIIFAATYCGPFGCN